MAVGSNAVAVERANTSQLRRPLLLLLAVLSAGFASLLIFFSSQARADTCPNAEFRIKSANLPDCRAYELVSPPDKNGGGVMLSSSRSRAAVAGDAFSFASLVAFGDVQGTAISAEYLARRTPEGWATHGITPQQEPMSGLLIFNGPGDAVFEGEFSPDLGRGVVRVNASPTSDPNVSTVSNLFARTNLTTPGPGMWKLVTESVAPIPPPWTGFTFPPPPVIVPATYKPFFAAASADFSHVVFESILNLTQDTIDAGLPTGTGDAKAYEWVSGTVRYVGVLPDSEGGGLVQAVAGRGASGLAPFYTHDTISDDGSRIFFTTPSTGGLYVRADGVSTERINASEKTPVDAAQPAEYRAATPDGSHVFFTTDEQLTADDDNGVSDLYRADLDQPVGARLTRLSLDSVPDDDYTPLVSGVLGISTDGEDVYFTARGQLLPDAPALPSQTLPTIYHWHDGQISFAGTLADGQEEKTNAADTTWGISSKTSRVSPDGRFAIFLTTSETQLDVNDHGGCGGIPCSELYVYDAAANGGEGSARCVSCDPEGGPATDDAGFIVFTGAGGSRQSSHQVQPLSADGRLAFFHTREPLLPEDHNSAFDVYEYDLLGDRLGLISSGAAEGGDSYFLDASASGRDVFFGTRDRLVGWDVDGSYDAYDARVGGGLPEPPEPREPCAGEACQGLPGSPPGASPPGSAGFREREAPGAGAVFDLLALSRAQLRRWAATGAVRLRVRVSEAGLVRARVRGRLGRKTRTVASSSRRADRAGTVQLPLRLSARARERLADGGRLRVVIAVSFSEADRAQRIVVVLGGGRR